MNVIDFNILLSRCKYDEEAFNALFDYFYPKIIVHINRKYPTFNFAQDIAQEFFLKVIVKKLPFIRKPVNWIYTVCDNIAKDNIKKESNTVPLLEKDIVCSVEEFINSIDEKHFSKTLLLSLPQEERPLVYLSEWEGYSMKEISVMLSTPYGQIVRRMKKIANKLRNLCKKR